MADTCLWKELPDYLRDAYDEEHGAARASMQNLSNEHRCLEDSLRLQEGLLHDREIQYTASLGRYESAVYKTEATLLEHHRAEAVLDQRSRQLQEQVEQLRKKSTDRGRHHAGLISRLRSELEEAQAQSTEFQAEAIDSTRCCEALRVQDSELRQELVQACAANLEEPASAMALREEVAASVADQEQAAEEVPAHTDVFTRLCSAQTFEWLFGPTVPTYRLFHDSRRFSSELSSDDS